MVAVHTIVERKTPLPHEGLSDTILRWTMFMARGVGKSYTEAINEIGIQEDNLWTWLKTGRPATAMHHKVIAALIDIDISEAVEDGDAFAQSQFILNAIAKLGKCDISHISRMLGSKTGTRRRWLNVEHRMRINELAIWAMLKYDFTKISSVDWQNRRVFFFEGERPNTRRPITIRGNEYPRPANPIDFIGRHIQPTKLEIDYVPGLGSVKKDTKTIEQILGAGEVGQVVMPVGMEELSDEDEAAVMEETIEQIFDSVGQEEGEHAEATEGEGGLFEEGDGEEGLAPVVDEDENHEDDGYEEDPDVQGALDTLENQLRYQQGLSPIERQAPKEEQEGGEEMVLAKDDPSLPPGYIGETVVGEDHKEKPVLPSGVFEGRAGMHEDASASADVLEGKDSATEQAAEAAVEETMPEEEWDVDNDGPNPYLPFSPRPGRNKQGEKLKWNMNRRRAGLVRRM